MDRHKEETESFGTWHLKPEEISAVLLAHNCHLINVGPAKSCHASPSPITILKVQNQL